MSQPLLILGNFFNLIKDNERLILIIFVLISLLVFYQYFISAKRIVFKPWVNLYDEKDATIGNRLGELLLFKIRYIKKIHAQSAKKLGLWNPYDDIPAFKQSLDDDVKLLASVELENYGKIISGILSILFKLIPLAVKPAQLEGSIQKYGEKMIFLVTIKNYRSGIFSRRTTLLWEKEETNVDQNNLPNLIEDLAYKIYLDLVEEDLFKTPECFKIYTEGVDEYIRFTNLGRVDDRENAEKKYLEALKKEDSNPAIAYNLGVLKYYKYDPAENLAALDYFKKSLNTQNKKLEARARSGITNALSQQMHRFDKTRRNRENYLAAIEFSRVAILIDRKNDAAHKAYAFGLHQYSEYLAPSAEDTDQQDVITCKIEAIKHYRLAVKYNSKHYVALNNLGNLYLEWAKTLQDTKVFYPRHRIEGKSTFLKKIFKSKMHITKPELLDMAKKAVQAAIKINSRYHHAHDNLGNIYRSIGNRMVEAEKAFRDATTYVYDYAEAHNDLAMLYLEDKKEEKKALLHFKNAVKYTKGSGQAKKLIEQFTAAHSKNNYSDSQKEADTYRALLAILNETAIEDIKENDTTDMVEKSYELHAYAIKNAVDAKTKEHFRKEFLQGIEKAAAARLEKEKIETYLPNLKAYAEKLVREMTAKDTKS
ncbi:hypothetical protein QQ020_03270 [Fulvivirgaceae bacterium BMA12]|uniref:Tetratricopeptide repeat protein n=1 Tax=Agaribacillus aureus TaxID=3051825 RepID=A0ABT8KZY4_9BACT|nr:hypothetical protein [Fulvivirgaceae bacterium BMA12]